MTKPRVGWGDSFCSTGGERREGTSFFFITDNKEAPPTTCGRINDWNLIIRITVLLSLRRPSVLPLLCIVSGGQGGRVALVVLSDRRAEQQGIGNRELGPLGTTDEHQCSKMYIYLWAARLEYGHLGSKLIRILYTWDIWVKLYRERALGQLGTDPVYPPTHIKIERSRVVNLAYLTP